MYEKMSGNVFARGVVLWMSNASNEKHIQIDLSSHIPISLHESARTSGVPLTPAVWHSAVCRSNQRCAAATIACTSGADLSESASEDCEPDMLSPPLSQICLNLKC